MKKTLVLLCAVAMLCSSFTFALAEDSKTISYYAFWCGDHEEGSYIETYIENALGIDLKVRKVAHTDAEAVNLMIAQDMPDCAWLDKTPVFMNDQEMIRSIPVDMVREYAPGLAAKMDEYPALWALALDPEDNTQLLYLPDVYDTYTEEASTCMNLRYDWILNLGIDLGDIQVEKINDRLYVADKGISLELLKVILDGFVNGDPDGNGEADTIGYMEDYSKLLSAYGLINDNVEYEGQAVLWYTHPKVKEMLTYLKELYAEGLLYAEIFTMDRARGWELINTGVSGIQSNAHPTFLNSWANNRPPLTVLEDENSTATILMIPGIADENGKTTMSTSLTPTGGEKFYVRWDVSDEKLVEILKFFDYCNYNADPTVTSIIWHGEEGVDWIWDEAGTTPIAPEGKSKLVGGDKDAQIFGRNTQTGNSYVWVTFEPLFEQVAKYVVKSYGGVWMDALMLPYKTDIYSETQATVISNEYSADWQQIRMAYFTDVIMGNKDIEADWDAYIQELNDAHYAEYLEELNKAPTTQEILDAFA